MAQPDPIDTLLMELRKDLSNTLTLINIVIALKRNQHHLLELLRGVLSELCQHIEQALPTLPSGEGDDDA